MAPLKFCMFLRLVLRSEREMAPPPVCCVRANAYVLRALRTSRAADPDRKMVRPLAFLFFIIIIWVSFISLACFFHLFSLWLLVGWQTAAPTFFFHSSESHSFRSRSAGSALLAAGDSSSPAARRPVVFGANRLLELISLTGVAKCSLSTKSLPSASFVHSSACFGVCGRGMRNHFFSSRI